MTVFQYVTMTLPARLDEGAMSCFEIVFSELLDSAATSHRRDDDGNWQIEVLFMSVPNAGLIDQLLAPLYQQNQITAVPINVIAVEKRDWLAENRAAFPPLSIGRFWQHKHGLQPQQL